MNWRRLGYHALLAVALALVVGRISAGVAADFLWYESLGASSLWREKAIAKLVLDGGAAVLGTAFIFANLYAVRASILKLILPRRVANLAFAEEVAPRTLTLGVALISVGLGALLVLAQGPWTAFALARHLPSWNKVDEYVERDLSFYVGWLPVEQGWYRWALAVLAATTVVVVVLYAVSSGLQWRRGALRLTRHARRHLFTLGAILLLVLAWGLRLERYEMLLEVGGGSFGLLDHIPGLASTIVLSLLYVAAAVLVFWAGWSGQVRVAFGVVTVMLTLTLLMRHVLPFVYGWSHPVSSEQLRERPYTETRNGYTRQAYALDSLILGTAGPLPAEPGTLRGNVPSWEPYPLALAVQRSTARGELVDAMGIMRTPDGVRQLMLERRTPDDSAATGASAWAVLVADPTLAGGDGRAPFASVTPRALPPVLVHENAAGYLVVLDSADVLRAPTLGASATRLVHAWATQNLRLAFGKLPPSAKLLTRRDVRTRVSTLAPFFEVGQFSIAMNQDSLYFIAHLYAASSTYPLSRVSTVRGRDWSYFRHASTAFVNAHTGRVLLTRGEADPIASAWFRRLPGQFVPWSAIPASLVSATPPPLESALVQAQAFAQVGARVMPRPIGRLLWPTGGDSVVRGDTPPLSIDVEGHSQLALPILRLRDDRIAGFVMAHGGSRPGTRFVPLTDTTIRWHTTAEELRSFQNDAAVRASDGRVVSGTVRVIPLQDDLFFMQSFYTWSASEAPRLAGVAVKSGGGEPRIVPTLTLALMDRIDPGIDTSSELLESELRVRAGVLFDSARAALQRGDWISFGTAYDALGRILGRPPP